MKKFLNRYSSKHKNNKLLYYAKNYLRQYIPKALYHSALQKKLASIPENEKEYILNRVNYYNKLDEIRPLPEKSIELKDFVLGKKHKTYFFDSYEYLRYFPNHYKVDLTFGDITTVPEVPSLLKSRPIHGENRNSVLLKLNKIRHFTFTKDSKAFLNKKDMLVGRMNAKQAHRLRFLEMYIDNPLCNLGQINKKGGNPDFLRDYLSIDQHLDYKYILCLEGYDVASSLKWVMSSNSIAIMCKPKYETWFMEGTLIADYHYIEIKDDFSDLLEKMEYYRKHPDKALEIIKHANEYVAQFKNKKREDLISLLVLEKYFGMTGQV